MLISSPCSPLIFICTDKCDIKTKVIKRLEIGEGRIVDARNAVWSR